MCSDWCGETFDANQERDDPDALRDQQGVPDHRRGDPAEYPSGGHLECVHGLAVAPQRARSECATVLDDGTIVPSQLSE
jgi:hypothetical protein